MSGRAEAPPLIASEGFDAHSVLLPSEPDRFTKLYEREGRERPPSPLLHPNVVLFQNFMLDAPSPLQFIMERFVLFVLFVSEGQCASFLRKICSIDDSYRIFF